MVASTQKLTSMAEIDAALTPKKVPEKVTTTTAAVATPAAPPQYNFNGPMGPPGPGGAIGNRGPEGPDGRNGKQAFPKKKMSRARAQSHLSRVNSLSQGSTNRVNMTPPKKGVQEFLSTLGFAMSSSPFPRQLSQEVPGDPWRLPPPMVAVEENEVVPPERPPSPLQMMWTIVGALLVTIAILTCIFLMYYLVAPYLNSILWAIVCSIVFHPSHSGSESSRVSKFMGNTWSSRLLCGPLLVKHVARQTSILFGFRTITLNFLGTKRTSRLRYTDLLWTSIMCYILMRGLGTVSVVVLSIHALISFVMLFLHAESTSVRYVTLVTQSFMLTAMCLTGMCLAWSTTIEALRFADVVRDRASDLNTVLEPHMTTLMPHIRTKAEEIAKDYHVTRYVRVLQETFSSFVDETNTWEERYEFARAAYTNVTLNFNMTEQMSGILMQVQKYALSGGISVLDVAMRLLILVAELVGASLGLLYEVVVFALLWSYLASQPRSILFYTFHKCKTMFDSTHIDVGDEKVNKFETNVRNRFWGLATSLLHVAVYHWCATYVAVWIVDFPFRVSASIAGALIALFPYIPKYFVATAPALLTAYFHFHNYQAVLISLTFLVFLSISGDSFLINIPDMASFVTAGSMVLGLTTFGLKGVLVGPIVAMGVQILWEATGDDDKPTSRKKETKKDV